MNYPLKIFFILMGSWLKSEVVFFYVFIYIYLELTHLSIDPSVLESFNLLIFFLIYLIFSKFYSLYRNSKYIFTNPSNISINLGRRGGGERRRRQRGARRHD